MNYFVKGAGFVSFLFFSKLYSVLPFTYESTLKPCAHDLRGFSAKSGKAVVIPWELCLWGMSTVHGFFCLCIYVCKQIYANPHS